jgi:Tol biopolymer transport system component
MAEVVRRLSIRHLATCAVAGSCSLLFVATATPASAGFPGTNGAIAFSSNRDADGDYEIYSVDTSGGSLTQLTDNTVTDSQPAYSADGTKIVFRRKTNNDDGEIYSMDADGSDVVRLTTNSVADGKPSWSPDGTKIAFVRGGTGDLYIMNADGSSVTQLTQTTVDETDPAWSPDGGWIAYARQDGNGFDVNKITTSGTNRTVLADCLSDVFCVSPDWSPDSAKIAYARWPDSGAAIWTMNADGSSKAQLTPNDSSTNAFPSWSPDGSAIAYTKVTSAGDIYRRDVAGGNVVQLTSGAADDWNSDWQPL